MISAPIFGHEGVAAHLETALASGRLHHAYLLAAGWQYQPGSICAAALLGRGEALLAGEAHRFYGAKDHRRSQNRQDAGEITRDQVSNVLEFLGKLALSPRKIVLIDAIDDLNVSAANSSKWLEEPRPGTLILAVCHRPGLCPRSPPLCTAQLSGRGRISPNLPALTPAIPKRFCVERRVPGCPPADDLIWRRAQHLHAIVGS